MRKNSIPPGASTGSSSGPSAAIRPRAKTRTSKSNPQTPNAGTPELPVDDETAPSELSAGPNQDPPEAGVDPTLPTNPVSGAPGHQVLESSSEDEDDEGRSTTEQLFDDGAFQAERDKVNEAAKAAEKDKRSAR